MAARRPSSRCVYGHYLYWANGDGYGLPGSIGRVDLANSRDVRQNFVPNEVAWNGTDLDQPCGVAVDSTGIYWGDSNRNAIARANLDGSGAGILITGASSPCGVTLVGGRIFWTNTSSGTVGEASASGTGVNESYITGSDDPCGVAAYGGYLYWTSTGAGFQGGMVNRVSLASPQPTADAQTIAMGIAEPCGVAVDGRFLGTLTLGTPRSQSGGRVLLSVTASAQGQITIRQASAGRRFVNPLTVRIGANRPTTARLAATAQARRILKSTRKLSVQVTVVYTPDGGISSTKKIWVVLRR